MTTRRTRSSAAIVEAVSSDSSTKQSLALFQDAIQVYKHDKASDSSGGPGTEGNAAHRRPLKRLSESRDSSTASKKRKSSGYAPPSKYAHLKGLTDSIAPGLLVLFVGHNPGVMTAATGHAYAHPSNHFWKLLHSSGLTDRRCSPTEDKNMPELYSLGLTNIVSRPTKDTAELSKEEQIAGTPILEEKVRVFRPEVVCIVGKSIWEAIWKYKHKRAIKKDEFVYGWQDTRHNIGVATTGADGDIPWRGARVFVATTTSGLAAALRPAEKEAIWKPLGDWAKQRRIELARLQAEESSSVTTSL